MSLDPEMTMITASKATNVKKVTGNVVPVGRLGHEAKKFQREIQSKTVPELRDLLSRQDQILNNQALLKTLPDKGAKVRAKKEQLEELIATRTRALNEAADLLANLSLGPSAASPEEKNNNKSSGKVDVDRMEWKYGGAHFIKKFSQVNPVMDSDDDTDDDEQAGEVAGGGGDAAALKLLASRSEVPTAPKAAKGPPAKAATNSYSKVLSRGEKARFIPSHSARVTLTEEDKAKIPLKHTEASPAKALSSPAVKKTDAIPPENMLKEGKFQTKTLDLQESLELQKEQATKLKQTQLEQAAARLREKLKVSSEGGSEPIQLTTEQMMAYRNNPASGDAAAAHDDYDHDHEDYDDEEEVVDDAAYGGNVSFTVTDYQQN